MMVDNMSHQMVDNMPHHMIDSSPIFAMVPNIRA